MAITAGTISVNAISGTVTKTAGSLAESIYDELVARYESENGTIPSGANGAPIKASFASMAEPIATAIVAQITTNGEAYITTSDGALQQAGGSDTNPPSAERSIGLR